MRKKRRNPQGATSRSIEQGGDHVGPIAWRMVEKPQGGPYAAARAGARQIAEHRRASDGATRTTAPERSLSESRRSWGRTVIQAASILIPFDTRSTGAVALFNDPADHMDVHGMRTSSMPHGSFRTPSPSAVYVERNRRIERGGTSRHEERRAAYAGGPPRA